MGCPSDFNESMQDMGRVEQALRGTNDMSSLSAYAFIAEAKSWYSECANGMQRNRVNP